MPKLWQSSAGQEEVNEAETSYMQFPKVQDAKLAFTAALAEFETLVVEERKCSRLLSPYVVGDGATVDSLDRLHAVAHWPEVKLKLALAEAAKIQAERQLRKVEDEARERVTRARVEGRKPLVKALFANWSGVCPSLRSWPSTISARKAWAGRRPKCRS